MAHLPYLNFNVIDDVIFKDLSAQACAELYVFEYVI